MRDPATLTAIEDVLRRVDLVRPLVTADERRRVPEEDWSALLAAGALRDGGSAGWVTCDQCDERHEEDVDWIENARGGPPQPVIECPVAGEVPVAPERLRQWLVDLPGLAELLARGLSCTGRVEELVPGRLWLLGRAAANGRVREVFFGRRLAERDGAAVLAGCTRFQASLSPLLLVPGVVPDRAAWKKDVAAVLALPSVVAFEGGALVADRAYVEGALPSEEPKAVTARPSPFATPPGATWNNVQIRFADAHTVSVRVLGTTGLFHYAQMGMEDRRTTLPTEQWKLLRTFAEAPGGVLDWENREARRTNKKRCEKLVKDLVRFFGIEAGTPIEYSKREKGWRAVLSVSV